MKCPACNSNSKYRYKEPNRIGPNGFIRRTNWDTKCSKCGYHGVEANMVESIDHGPQEEHVKKSPIGKTMEKSQKNE